MPDRTLALRKVLNFASYFTCLYELSLSYTENGMRGLLASNCLLVCAFTLCTLIRFMVAPAHAQDLSSYRLGTNLAEVNDYSPQLPFKDIFLYSREWITQCTAGVDTGCTNENAFDTGESSAIDLDESGWVKSLTPTTSAIFTSVATFWDIPAGFPGGTYIVRYSGTGTLAYGLAAQKNAAASSPGRDVITVTPANGGILLRIVATSPADYIRDIHVVRAEDESSFTTTRFTTDFLNRLEPYQALRFMDWMRTNNSIVSSWSSRAKTTDARFSTAKGVPAEVMIDLANQSNKAPWFTMPHQASDEYLANFAALAKANLNASLPVFVEYSNEIWNDLFSQGSFLEAQGDADFGLAGDPFIRRLNFHGKRSAQMCDIWRSAFAGSESRVVCIIASQAANSFTASEALSCPLWSAGAPCAGHGITALAVAPYMGDYIGQEASFSEVASWLSESDGGVSKVFAELSTGAVLSSSPSGGAIAQSFGWIEENLEVANTFNVSLLAYEGGQHLVGIGAVGNNDGITALFTSVNRDSRMQTLYSDYLNGWKSRSGGLFMHFTDITPYSRFGSWGALETIGQSSSPKFDALKLYVGLTPSQQSHTVTVSRRGRGGVTSRGRRINCGLRCRARFQSGQTITLTATPARGHTFKRWNGACSHNRRRCSFVIQRSIRVGAIFGRS